MHLSSAAPTRSSVLHQTPRRWLSAPSKLCGVYSALLAADHTHQHPRVEKRHRLNYKRQRHFAPAVASYLRHRIIMRPSLCYQGIPFDLFSTTGDGTELCSVFKFPISGPVIPASTIVLSRSLFVSELRGPFEGRDFQLLSSSLITDNVAHFRTISLKPATSSRSLVKGKGNPSLLYTHFPAR